MPNHTNDRASSYLIINLKQRIICVKKNKPHLLLIIPSCLFLYNTRNEPLDPYPEFIFFKNQDTKSGVIRDYCICKTQKEHDKYL